MAIWEFTKAPPGRLPLGPPGCRGPDEVQNAPLCPKLPRPSSPLLVPFSFLVPRLLTSGPPQGESSYLETLPGPSPL